MSILMQNNDFCSFSRSNGNVVYKNINIITGEEDTPIQNLNNGELINHSEIYISKDKKVYHKSFNLSLDNSDSRYLVWQKTKGDDWDWYTSNIIVSDLVCIKDLYNEKLNSQDTIDTKIKYLTMKTEIMTNTYIVSKKHGLNTEDTLILTKLIEETVDNFTHNKFD